LAQKTIYLIRHGETDYNRRGVVQGSGVDSDLNEMGQAQATAFFRRTSTFRSARFIFPV
jgi:probable phosphoglycerate mutase